MSILPLVTPISLYFFFTKHKVVPVGYFQILIQIQTEPFSGLTFLGFFGKNVNFFNLPYIMFYQSCSKVDFTTWNSILFQFFTKH